MNKSCFTRIREQPDYRWISSKQKQLWETRTRLSLDVCFRMATNRLSTSATAVLWRRRRASLDRSSNNRNDGWTRPRRREGSGRPHQNNAGRYTPTAAAAAAATRLDIVQQNKATSSVLQHNWYRHSERSLTGALWAERERQIATRRTKLFSENSRCWHGLSDSLNFGALFGLNRQLRVHAVPLANHYSACTNRELTRNDRKVQDSRHNRCALSGWYDYTL